MINKLNFRYVILIFLILFLAWCYFDSFKYDKEVNQEDHSIIMNKDLEISTIAPRSINRRPKNLLNLIHDLEGARMSDIPKFKTMEEAKVFGAAHSKDDAIIHELFAKACTYKQIALSTNLKEALDDYLLYKAAWEAARGIEGARIADSPFRVIDVGTGDGSFLPKIKAWLEARGFRNVVVCGVDNGDWGKDETLPKLTDDIRKELVELSESVLMGKSGGQSFKIYHADAMLHWPHELRKTADAVWLNAPPQNMTCSFVQRALRLLNDNPGSMVVLRYEDKSRNFMNVSQLQILAFEHELTVDIVHSGTMPTGEAKLYATTYFIKRGKYEWRQSMFNADEYFERVVSGSRMAGRAA